MRIAYVCADPGIPVFGSKGASIHAQAVLRVLSDLGHELHLITPRPGGEPHVPVTVHTLPAVGRGATADRERAAQASDAAVADLLTHIEPDLVYERYSLWGRTATAWAEAHGVSSLLEANAPLVEEQSAYRELVDRAAAEDVARSVLSHASAVVCVSEAVAAWAQSWSSHPERVVTLPNGVDTDRIVPTTRSVTPAAGTPFTVGFVGTLKAWHGLDTLVGAFAALARTDPSWRLLIVGDGPLRAEVADLAAAAGVGDLVELTGAVPADEVTHHLQRMDVACAPYPQQDTFYFSPLKVYEYLAAGLPVVASAIGQVPDALDHGRLGRLVAPGDAAALAVGLDDLRSDLSQRTTLRTTTRAAALEHHTWTSVVLRALALVPELEPVH